MDKRAVLAKLNTVRPEQKPGPPPGQAAGCECLRVWRRRHGERRSAADRGPSLNMGSSIQSNLKASFFLV
jgi:hypothetical protein